MENRSYHFVDVVKFFFAICIVALHSYAFDWLPRGIYFLIHKGIFRLAVPYFFVASGFFYSNHFKSGSVSVGPTQMNQLRNRYCKRILIPFLFFGTINMIQQIFSQAMKGESMSSILDNTIRHAVFMPYGGLWYLLASIIGITILTEFLKRNHLNAGIVLGFVLYCFALLCNNYYFVIQGTPIQKLVDWYLALCISPRNGVFTGFLFLSLGAKCREWMDKWTVKQLLTALLPLYILYVLEFVLVYVYGIPKDDGSLYICHLMILPVLFLVTCQHEIKIDGERAKLLRNLSTGMYLLHLPILWFLWLFRDAGIVNFPITLFLSIGICLLSYRSSSKWLGTLLK